MIDLHVWTLRMEPGETQTTEATPTGLAVAYLYRTGLEPIAPLFTSRDLANLFCRTWFPSTFSVAFRPVREPGKLIEAEFQQAGVRRFCWRNDGSGDGESFPWADLPGFALRNYILGE